MISRKQALALLFLSLLSFAPYFVHPFFVDADPYYFLNQICNGPYASYYYNENILANYFFDIVPCNFLILKISLFVGFFLSVLSISFLGTLFNKQYGWMAGVFSFLSPLLSREFLKLENDQFGYVFLFWSLYFFFKAKVEKNKGYFLVSGAFVLAGVGFWSGGLFFPIAFGLNSLFFLPIAVSFAFFFGEKLLGTLMPSILLIPQLLSGIGQRIVLERQPLIGIVYWFGLALAITFYRKEYFPQLLFFALLGIVSVKFAVLAVPLLSVSMVLLYTKLLNKKKAKIVVLGKIVQIKKIARFFVVASVSLALAWGLLIPFNVPTQNEWDAIDFGLEKAQEFDFKFVNHWDLGYWVQWRGGKASALGTIVQQDYNSMKNTIVLTHEDVSCKILKTFQKHKVYYCE